MSKRQPAVRADHITHSQRASASASEGDRTILNGVDEDRIGEPFYKFQQLKAIDPRSAIQAFSQFKAGLTRRMDSEDDELFAVFEARAGKYAKEISERMRQEHRQIREILNAIEAKLSQADFATDSEERDLEAALIAHNHRETRVVYSALE